MAAAKPKSAGARRPVQVKGRTTAAGAKKTMTKAVATKTGGAKSSGMGLAKTKPKTRGAGS